MNNTTFSTAAISIVFASYMLVSACKNDLPLFPESFPPEMANVEEIHDFVMLYSDSAKVRVRVRGPVMWRHLDEKNPRQEFPEGIEVEFFDANFRVNSRLSS